MRLWPCELDFSRLCLAKDSHASCIMTAILFDKVLLLVFSPVLLSAYRLPPLTLFVNFCPQSSDTADRYEQVSPVPRNHLPARPVQLPTKDQQTEFSQGNLLCHEQRFCFYL